MVMPGAAGIPFNLTIPVYEEMPRTYEGLQEFLIHLESLFAPGHLAEGVVFHHPDGRRAKIKRKDLRDKEWAATG